MKYRQVLVDESKWNIKCPYEMKPEYITVHNSANDASAENEVKYMISNDNEVSFHYAVDDQEAVQGILTNRNSWNAGDGINGTGNRKSIAVEICYSKSGGDRFIQAEKNAAQVVADLLHGWDLSLDRVKKHQDWNGKYCPHRTLDLGWDRFLKMVSDAYYGTESEPVVKEADQILHVGSKVRFNGVFKANEVIAPNGKYPNGAVGCYDLCYGAPVGKDDYIPCGPLAKCNADGSNANYNAVIYPNDYFKCDKTFTVIGVEAPTTQTKNGVAILEADGVRFRCDCGPLYEVSDN